jgi:hypothetical protein
MRYPITNKDLSPLLEYEKNIEALFKKLKRKSGSLQRDVLLREKDIDN